MKKSALVLGGAGFVGSHVCEKLVRQGWNVTLPTRRRSNAQHLQHLEAVNVLELNVHDEAALSQVAQGHDAVVNLVAILHGDAAAFDRVHVVLPQKLARACQNASVRHVVHVSALGVSDTRPGDAPSEYLRSKGRGEAVLLRAAAESGLKLTILRPSVIFGAEDKFLNLFARLQKVFPVMPLAGADARFQPVWVEDVAMAVVRSLEQGVARTPTGDAVQILEACGPHVFTLRELVQLSAQLSGVNHGRGRPVIGLPDWMGRMQAWLMEHAPGTPLMSRDNLDSMQVDNVATGQLPGLQALGMTPSALKPIAEDYLRFLRADYGLQGMRQRACGA
jgi:NADH dehydrogenase